MVSQATGRSIVELLKEDGKEEEKTPKDTERTQRVRGCQDRGTEEEAKEKERTPKVKEETEARTGKEDMRTQWSSRMGQPTQETKDGRNKDGRSSTGM